MVYNSQKIYLSTGFQFQMDLLSLSHFIDIKTEIVVSLQDTPPLLLYMRATPITLHSFLL